MSWFSRKHTDEIAKERLKLILVQDRSLLSPSVLNELKEDILKVINRYVEVGESDISIDIRRETHKTILEAVVPVKGVKKS
ncbi:MAG: cell division topological specificity factor MinE [Caldisericaceae bacterium]|jgi:cell division topological specificity factor|nr:cell division topological specificity factor MinE [Caldisericaceae bacterium]